MINSTTIGKIAMATSFALDKNSLEYICHILRFSATVVVDVVGTVFFRKRLKSITENIGPMELKAIRPKLSSSSCLLLTTENPMPKAIRNGTEMGPVVTLPESNAMATKLGSQNMARMKITA